MPWMDGEWVGDAEMGCAMRDGKMYLMCLARCAATLPRRPVACAHLDALAGERGLPGVGGKNVEMHQHGGRAVIL